MSDDKSVNITVNVRYNPDHADPDAIMFLFDELTSDISPEVKEDFGIVSIGSATNDAAKSKIPAVEIHPELRLHVRTLVQQNLLLESLSEQLRSSNAPEHRQVLFDGVCDVFSILLGNVREAQLFQTELTE